MLTVICDGAELVIDLNDYLFGSGKYSVTIVGADIFS